MRPPKHSHLRRGFLAISAIAATASLAPRARANYIISLVGPTQVANGDAVYVLQALNDGTNNSGMDLLGVDAVIDTPGTGTAGAIVTHTEGLGARRTVDVTGLGEDDDAFFGDATAGTFIGVGSNSLPQVPPDTYTDPNTASTTVSGGFPDAVYVNSQTRTQIQPGMFRQAAVYQGTGTFDPAFTTNSLHSLEVGITIANNPHVPQGIPDSLQPLPIANIVVPAGTPISFSAELLPDVQSIPPNPTQVITGTILAVSLQPTPTLTAAIPDVVAVGNLLNPPGVNTPDALTVSKSGGGYIPSELKMIGPPAVNGKFSFGGFPGTTTTGYVLFKLTSTSGPLAGSDPTLNPTALADILKFINGDDGGLVASKIFPQVAASVTETYSIEFAIPDFGTAERFGSFDFSAFSDSLIPAGSLAVTDIAVAVPEPTGISVLMLGGMGLLARRRRI